MNLKLAICDDEPEQLNTLRTLVSRWGEEQGHTLTISLFPSAEAFLFQYEEDNRFDVLLLDVEMGTLSGIDLAKHIRRDKSRAEIIFITSHLEFYGEGYEVDALHYLIKPVAADKLCAVLTKAAGRLAEEPPSVVITADGAALRLYESDILSVESQLHYITIRTTGGEYRVKENLSDFAAALSEDFYRTHRSYLVSLKHIVRIARTAVTLDDGTEVPLSRGRYDDIHRAFIARN